MGGFATPGGINQTIANSFISQYFITNPQLTTIVKQSTTTRNTYATEQQMANPAYTKMWEGTLAGNLNECLLAFQMKCDNGTGYIKVYVNGVWTGTYEYSENANTYTDKSELMTGLHTGDKVQLYIKAATGNVFVRNIAFKYSTFINSVSGDTLIAFLETTIDPTITITGTSYAPIIVDVFVTNTLYDCWVKTDNDYAYNTSPLYSGQAGSWAYMTIVGFAVNVPKNATITAAYLLGQSKGSDGVTHGIYYEQADNASYVTGYADYGGRTWGNASATLLGRLVRQQSSSIVTAVQELVNRAGWVSGNRMNFALNSGSNTDAMMSLEDGATVCYELHIEYTLP